MQTAEVLKRLGDIYRMFEDKLSRELYLNRLSWLVTGDFTYIESIVKKSHPNIPVWNRREENEFVNILPKNKRIVFYGMGGFSKRLISYLDRSSVKPIFCDSDVRKQADDFYGYQVIQPAELFRIREPKRIVICTIKYMEEVKEYLLNNGIEEKEIVDIRPFFKCGTGDDYFYEDFLCYSDQEVFVDAGCYDLGSTVDFARLCNGLKKVYAFEPDPVNYEACLRRIEREKAFLPEIRMLPYGTWNGQGEVFFDSTADGCAHIGDGKNVIKTAAIDEIVEEDDRITFIKMDVEGAELESLKGAESIIKRDKPKLAICIYHKAEDMVTLPLYIKTLVPEYKFYLRSYSNAENEMVLYAVL